MSTNGSSANWDADFERQQDTGRLIPGPKIGRNSLRIEMRKKCTRDAI
jgi:hypothetical protein